MFLWAELSDTKELPWGLRGVLGVHGGSRPVLSVHQGVGGCLSCVLPTAQLGPVGGAVPVHWDKGFTAHGLSALTQEGLKFASRSQGRAAKASAWQKLQRLSFKGQAALPTQEPAVSQGPAPQPLLPAPPRCLSSAGARAWQQNWPFPREPALHRGGHLGPRGAALPDAYLS